MEVDPESLHSEDGISINGMALKFSNTVPPHGFVYKTDLGDEAVISYNEETGNIFGTLKTHDGKSFALEKCRSQYIFEEFDLHAFATSEGDPPPQEAEEFIPANLKSIKQSVSKFNYFKPLFIWLLA